MAQCMMPFYIKRTMITSEQDYKLIQVPCGKCPNCRSRRINGWVFRLEQQLKVASSAEFLTLTYGTSHLPFSEKGLPTLSKRDVQLFMKRLRKLNDEKLSYYLVGEYGGKTQRPHYHILLFNHQVGTVEKAWQLGEVHHGETEIRSIRYTLKYLHKVGTVGATPGDDRQKEFQHMSKGIGANYLTEENVKFHTGDVNVEDKYYLPGVAGQKTPMPRYYRDKIYNESQKFIIANHFQKEQEKKDEKITVTKIRNKIQAQKAAKIRAEKDGVFGDKL